MRAARARAAVVAGTLAAAGALAGCGSSPPTSPAVPGPVQGGPVLPRGPNWRCAFRRPAQRATRRATAGHPTASLAPAGPPPAPGQMPAGSYMAAIASRGYLRGGGRSKHLPVGLPRSRDGKPGRLRHRHGQPGGPGHLRLRLSGSYPLRDRAECRPVVRRGQRPGRPGGGDHDDHLPSGQQTWISPPSTTTPARRVLVPDGSPITSLAGLAGKRVCAAAGSTSLANLARAVPTAQLVSVTNQTDCLVMLQQGQIDAISTDDTILQGLAAQDPHVHLVPGLRLSD